MGNLQRKLHCFLLGFNPNPCTHKERQNDPASRLKNGGGRGRNREKKRKQLFIQLVDTGISHLGGRGFSLGNVVMGDGFKGDGEQNTFRVLPAAFAVLYYASLH